MSSDARQRYRFMLFVAEGERNSVAAMRNLEAFCRAEIDGQYELTVVDVFADAQPALEHGIVLTPALLVLEPEPRVVVAGSLSDLSKIRLALRLPEPASRQ